MKAVDDSTRPESSSSASESSVESLLYDLLELPAPARPAALAALCRRHPEHAETLQRRFHLLASELPQALVDEETAQFGRFQLLRRLGGGTAEVFHAVDTDTGAQVVLKLLRHPQLLAAVVQGSFAREAIAASRLHHPGLGPVLEVGAHDGTPFLVQPYVPGITLADWIRHRAARRHGLGRADVELVLGWLEGILRALAVAHAAGLVHRDVKPSNVLLPFQGAPRLLDFGLCHDVGAAGANGATPTPTPGAGTLAYMAPELLQGTGATVQPAIDVYAVGVTLFEALALRLPFAGANEQALCHTILLQEPPDLRRFLRGRSRDLRRVLACALAKDPAARYATAAAFADDLARLRTDRPVLAPRLPWRTRCWQSLVRSPWRAAALGMLLAMGAGLWVGRTVLAGGEEADADLLALPAAVRAARERAAALVPGWPGQVPALVAWLQRDGERLAAHLPRLHARVAELERDPAADPVVLLTLRAAASDLSAFAAGERSTLQRVRERLQWARTVGERTLQAPDAAWQETIAAVAASPRYGGLRLGKQIDLVPLGPDPKSGLFEFHHPRSGWDGPPPHRDERGRLQLHDGSGLVFVLVPGGRCLIGEQRTDPNGRRYDPDAAYYAEPHEVELAPFFLSKYEMTKGQWLRLTGHDPSAYRVGERPHGDPLVTLRHPVESVTALECDELMREVGLVLPTEAQWEYACGCNAPTRWFFGDDPAEQVRYGNVDDRRFLAARRPVSPTQDFDDGYTCLAPVGSYAANPFGLHDVVGNVAEWCRDVCADYRLSVPAPGDGLRTPSRPDPLRSYRGSRYWQAINKTSSRPGMPPDLRDDGLGLRPARPLQEGGR